MNDIHPTRGALIVLAVIVAAVVLAPTSQAEARTPPQPNYRCPVCLLVVGGEVAAPAGISLGGAAIAGAAAAIGTAAVVHQNAGTVVQSKPDSPKAKKLKAWARAWKVNGKAIWRATGKWAWGAWRFFKARFGVAHLISQFPNAAAACATAAVVTVATGDTALNALKACIGAAFGVYAVTK